MVSVCFRKAVKAFDVLNLAVYVAQDCTGESLAPPTTGSRHHSCEIDYYFVYDSVTFHPKSLLKISLKTKLLFDAS